ncbi:MAG: hypothetical protein CMF50_08305 [Legionellales bacterium]|nr:hypothetical protein [Legionellales bacterium]|tara:strand:- start:33292 stop:35505 length:2214 start_codon:yes stop_codon:yes gene_type:complete
MFLQKKDGRVVEVAPEDRSDYARRTGAFTQKTTEDRSVGSARVNAVDGFAAKAGGDFPKGISAAVKKEQAYKNIVPAGDGNVRVSGSDFGDDNIYGDGVFEITVQELEALREQSRIFLDPELPSAFYRALLLAVNKDRKDARNFKSLLRGNLIESGNEIQGVADAALNAPTRYGFRDKAHAEKIVNMNLSNIGRMVCVAQQVYSMVRQGYQLGEKSQKPHALISAAGLDFNENHKMIELYFENGGFKEGAPELLFNDILALVHLEMMAMKEMGVKDASFIATGCGKFLAGVPEPCKDIVREYYAAARFLLLKHGDYGFENCYFHPGDEANIEPMKRMFNQFAGDGVVFQNDHDSFFLADEASREGRSAGVTGGSDAEFTTSGKGGKDYDKIVRAEGASYGAEETQFSISTAVNATLGVDTNLYTQTNRQQNVAGISNRAAILAEARVGGMFIQESSQRNEVIDACIVVTENTPQLYQQIATLDISDSLKQNILVARAEHANKDKYSHHDDISLIAAFVKMRGMEDSEIDGFIAWCIDNLDEKNSEQLEPGKSNFKKALVVRICNILSSEYFSTVSLNSDGGKEIVEKLKALIKNIVSEINKHPDRVNENLTVLDNTKKLLDKLAALSNNKVEQKEAMAGYYRDQYVSDTQKMSKGGKLGQFVVRAAIGVATVVAAVITPLLGVAIVAAPLAWNWRPSLFKGKKGTRGEVNKSVEDVAEEAHKHSPKGPGNRGGGSGS